MVNSSADWGPSTAMSVPLTVVELRKRGLAAPRIQQLVWDNPYRFYDQTGRLSKLFKS
jgi:predicted metal-dependent TIM-barrel fold hydrolase